MKADPHSCERGSALAISKLVYLQGLCLEPT
jgi:hypothetical protein